MGNWFKTTFLLGIMTLIIVLIGNLLGGAQGMIFAFIIAIGMNFFSYYYSDKIVLRMYKAKEVTPGENPRLYEMVGELSQRAGLPIPRVYMIPEDSPNAFATGRNPEHAVVAVTSGLMNLMNRDEIMGVISHELAHIKNRDILVGSIAATMAGAIMIVAQMARWTAIFGGGSSDEEGGFGGIGLILMSIIAPIAAMVVQMAISRSREYHADSTGASFTGNPSGLANALQKLGEYSRRLPMNSSPSTAHMFIVNPLSGSKMASLFSTHPPLEDRIARLTGKTFTNGPSLSINEKKDGLKAAKDTWRNLQSR